MEVNVVHDEGQTLDTPVGKLLAVIDTQEEFNKVLQSLEKGGFSKVDVFKGEEGLHLLERVHNFFWGDSEGKVLERHIQELKAGHYILAVETPSKRSNEAAAIVSAHGGRFLVHFGLATVTWLK